MQCLKCGGDTWNNAEKIAGGWNGPLFKCKDRNCDWVQWPPKEKKVAKPETKTPVGNGSDDARVIMFWDSFDSVLAGIRERKLTDMFTPEHICKLVATLYIGRH